MRRACPCGRVEPCPDHPKTPRNGSTRAWRTLRAKVLERDGHRCQLRLDGCTMRATTVDHDFPVSAGGSDHMDNLVAACAPCNLKKAN